MPPFNAAGNLPPGMHRASWEEIRQRFGGSARREALLDAAMEVIRALRRAGCRGAWLNGSFVSDVDDPEDFDLCYELTSTRLDQLPSTLRDPKTAKRTYGGDVFPTHAALPFLDFFQRDRDGNAKGIIEIDLGSLP